MLSFSAERVKNNRLQVLDVLRGVAVLGVLFRHWTAVSFLTNMGWIGVDLFFVISGFLISNLLFSEYDKHQKIEYLRFFVRRAFKIYPLFFFLLAGSITWIVLWGQPVAKRLFMHEFLFLQNYLGGVFIHTWSLAVEEHFYVLLLLLFGVFFGKRRNFLIVAITIMIVCLVVRLVNCAQGNPGNHFYTHTRVDSLFMGVALAYLWRYRRGIFDFMKGVARYLILGLCIVTLGLFGFVPAESMFTQGVGFSLIGAACAGILIFALTSKGKERPAATPLALAGYYSYSIYLFHIPVKIALEKMNITENSESKNYLYFVLYVALSIAAGIIFSEIIEQPLLRLRNKILPSKA